MLKALLNIHQDLHALIGKYLKTIQLQFLKKSLTLNEPIYVGFTVLELNKWEIDNFHYNFMKKNFKRCKLLFTDTDNLCHEFDEVLAKKLINIKYYLI